MNQHKGFSLIELMIAMLLGIIVVGGALSIYITTIRGSSDTVKSARLNHDIDSAMQLMVNDIRRAGHWAGAIAGSDAKNNPFTQVSPVITNIQISNKTGEVAESCILYTYEGELDNGTYDLNEFYGFRLNGDGIDMRYSVGSISSISCNDPNWENIINTDKIKITKLEFKVENSKCFNKTAAPPAAYVSTASPPDTSCAAADSAGFLATGDIVLETRQIDITLDGDVTGDEGVVTKSLAATVKVRNNRIFTQP